MLTPLGFFQRQCGYVGTGPTFIHPHPPTRENALLGVGGMKDGGYEISRCGALQNIHPPPKMALWPQKGEGGEGGKHRISPWKCGYVGACNVANFHSFPSATRYTLRCRSPTRLRVLGVSQRPLTLILLQKYRDTNGRRIVIQIGGVYTTFCQEEGIFLQKYRDRNGRYRDTFSKVSGSGVDLTFLRVACARSSDEAAKVPKPSG